MSRPAPGIYFRLRAGGEEMKLHVIIEQGFILNAWMIRTVRNERRVVLKLSKITPHGEKFYVAHSPQVGASLRDVEFTEPVLLQAHKKSTREARNGQSTN